MASADKFIEYCVTGNINGIKKMSLKDCDLNKGFRKACQKGHYMIVRYLIELYKIGNPNDETGNPNYKMIDIHLHKELGFVKACYNGHYMVVKYLVELYKTENYDMTNIHAYNEDGFGWACENGHYMIVKYLIELYKNDKNYKKINIHYLNEYSFRRAYYARNYMIVKYLMTICKKHKYKPFNNYLMIFDKFNKYKL